MRKPVCTGLGITHRLADHRDVLKRIHRYAEAKPERQFTSMVPEPRSRGVADRFRPDALITLANTQTPVRTLSAWQRPEVNVPLSFRGCGYRV
jgi:hypothetical protein